MCIGLLHRLTVFSQRCIPTHEKSWVKLAVQLKMATSGGEGGSNPHPTEPCQLHPQPQLPTTATSPLNH